MGLQGLSRTTDFAEDLLALRLPSVRLRLEVALRQIAHDIIGELAHAGEAPFADDILRQLSEEALDQIEPGRARRREVNMKSRMLCEPLLDTLLFVGAVVVDDQVQIQVLRRFPVDLLEETKPFDVRMARFRPRDQFAVEVIQCGKQRDGAMPCVVVGLGADLSDGIIGNAG